MIFQHTCQSHLGVPPLAETANCDSLSFDMCTLESFQESLFFLKTESGVTFFQKVELTPNAALKPSFFFALFCRFNCVDFESILGG